MMLHHDEGYQKDVGDPKAMDAVLTELKQHPDRLARYLLLHMRSRRDLICKNLFGAWVLLSLLHHCQERLP